ncbi:MAG TPA: hypothetical protein VFH51_02530 [Myxococcota bacterium]|nr:hypothetical protein [Myxococcota bacterium]
MNLRPLSPTPTSAPNDHGASRHCPRAVQVRSADGPGAKSLVQLTLDGAQRIPLRDVAAFAAERDIPPHLVGPIIDHASRPGILLPPDPPLAGTAARTLAELPQSLRPMQAARLEEAETEAALSCHQAIVLSASSSRLSELRTLLTAYLQVYGVTMPEVGERTRVWLDGVDDLQAQRELEMGRAGQRRAACSQTLTARVNAARDQAYLHEQLILSHIP